MALAAAELAEAAVLALAFALAADELAAAALAAELGTVVLQVGTVMTLLSRVTDPLRASTRPLNTAEVFRVIELKAITVPVKEDAVPNVAELPTRQ